MLWPREDRKHICLKFCQPPGYFYHKKYQLEISMKSNRMPLQKCHLVELTAESVFKRNKRS